MQHLICSGCGTPGPGAERMPRARELAGLAGWQLAKRSPHVSGDWAADFCPECALKHPRIFCTGVRKRPCTHPALVTITREDGTTVHACGSHHTVLAMEMIRGGRQATIKETPL